MRFSNKTSEFDRLDQIVAEILLVDKKIAREQYPLEMTKSC